MNDSDDGRNEPLLAPETSDVTSLSSSSGGGGGMNSFGPSSSSPPPSSAAAPVEASASDYQPPASTSVNDRIAGGGGGGGGGGGAPPALPASMPPDTVGARRRTKVSLKDYLERNKPGGFSDGEDDDEEEQQQKQADDRKSKRRGRSRSRGRSKFGGKSRGGDARSVRSSKSHSTLRTDATGLLSVREVRKAWGAMFFAAVMGSFVGTGGLHRLLQRGLLHPQPSDSEAISRVPPPPPLSATGGGRLRGKYEPRAYDLDTEGYEDAMDMVAADNAAQSRDKKAAESAARAKSQIESKLPPELRSVGVDEEAMRDMEILRDISEGMAKAKGETEAADVDLTLLRREEQNLLNEGTAGALRKNSQHEATTAQKKEKKKIKKAVVVTEELRSPVFGVGVEEREKEGIAPEDEEEEEEDELAAAVKDDDEDDRGDGGDDEGEGKAGGYAPVSGKRPRRNGDGTIPNAAKP